jgi:hypothetical protein
VTLNLTFDEKKWCNSCKHRAECQKSVNFNKIYAFDCFLLDTVARLEAPEAWKLLRKWIKVKREVK